jgi:hypothetical protein
LIKLSFDNSKKQAAVMKALSIQTTSDKLSSPLPPMTALSISTTTEILCSSSPLSPSVSRIPSFLNLAETWGFFPTHQLEILAKEQSVFHEAEEAHSKLKELDGLSTTSSLGSSASSSEDSGDMALQFQEITNQYDSLSMAYESFSFMHRASTFAVGFRKLSNC